MNLASLVREASGEPGNDAKIPEVKGYPGAKYPSLPIKDSTLSTTVYNMRKKLVGSDSPSKSAVIRSAPGESPGEPTLRELLRARDFATEEGGLDELRDQVERLVRLSKEFGSLDRLFACLDGLAKLAR